VFREGDLASCWYIVLSGSVGVVNNTTPPPVESATTAMYTGGVSSSEERVLIAGTVFGEAIDHVQPHSCSCWVRAVADLFRIEHYDFKMLMQRYGRSDINRVLVLLSQPPLAHHQHFNTVRRATYPPTRPLVHRPTMPPQAAVPNNPRTNDGNIFMTHVDA
jgi:CRP-like cAMP-binding protein